VIHLIIYIIKAIISAFDDSDAKRKVVRRPAVQDPEAAERTRRVQEEIRKKIAARRAGAPGQAPAQPGTTPASRVPPLVRPTSVPPIDTFGGPMRGVPKVKEPVAARQAVPELDAETAAIIERQRQLAEQMQALEAAKRAQQQRAGEIGAARSVVPATSGAQVRREVVAELRDPHALRRAIVLREVLGAPVGLR
jgi:hypothetical protein